MDDCIVNIHIPNVSASKKPHNQLKKFEHIKPQKKTKRENKEISVKADKVEKDEKRTVKNPLQFGIDNKKVTVKDSVFDSLLGHSVEAKIEPVFSNKSWEDVCNSVNIHPYLKSCILERFKLQTLTAIQWSCLPPLLDGKDVLVRAQTGSGKTLAYAVPIWNQLITFEPTITRLDGPLVLVILPTRELATQTFDVFRILAQSCVRVVPGVLIGGMKRKSQKSSLRKGINVVIGTPQRILDHLEHTSSLNLNTIRWLVIDEADRLLEMGFERDVHRIVDKLTESQAEGVDSKVRTVLLSATLTSGVEDLAGLTLTNPVRCVIQDTDSEIEKGGKCLASGAKSKALFSLPSGLKHYVLIVPWKLRLVSLAAFILLKCKYHKYGGKLIVFMATHYCIDFHYKLFKAVFCDKDESASLAKMTEKLSIYRLHGNMEHKTKVRHGSSAMQYISVSALIYKCEQMHSRYLKSILRESEFSKFASSFAGVLFTTDVSSRGLDLTSVSWVIQYHVTGGSIDYVHRVGRTARAGGRGKALVFLEQEETSFMDLLKTKIGIDFNELNLGDLLQTVLFHLRHADRFRKKALDGTMTVEEGTSRFFNLFLKSVDDDETLSALAQTAYISYLRAYASLSGELRTIFNFKRLHLGHIARAFCLKQKPSDVAGMVTGRLKKHKDRRKRGFEEGEDEEVIDVAKDGVSKSCSKLSFEQTESDKSKKRFKPSDLARLNMLAEYGL